MHSSSPRAPRRSRWRRGVAIAAAVLVAVAAIVAIVVSVVPKDAAAPAAGLKLFVSPDTKASDAASAGGDSDAVAAAEYLATMPTAVWLTPEAHPVGAVGTYVSLELDRAQQTDSTPVLVVYGLPDRDCGQYSAGGLEADAYGVWTEEIGDALRDAAEQGRTSAHGTIVILEPDSLALASECGSVEDRASHLRTAVDHLAGDDVWIYLDGGHSNWKPATQMAALIQSVGTDGVRGFVTNVSNYNSLSDEVDYAHELAEQLGGAHAVIDTSRSGAGSTGDWCNPPGSRIGEPAGTFGDEVVDVNLWVKPPGESDGTCNGGPPAGAWWPEAAVELTADVID